MCHQKKNICRAPLRLMTTQGTHVTIHSEGQCGYRAILNFNGVLQIVRRQVVLQITHEKKTCQKCVIFKINVDKMLTIGYAKFRHTLAERQNARVRVQECILDVNRYIQLRCVKYKSNRRKLSECQIYLYLKDRYCKTTLYSLNGNS